MVAWVFSKYWYLEYVSSVFLILPVKAALGEYAVLGAIAGFW